MIHRRGMPACPAQHPVLGMLVVLPENQENTIQLDCRSRMSPVLIHPWSGKAVVRWGVKHHTVTVIAKSSANQEFRSGCIEGLLGL